VLLAAIAVAGLAAAGCPGDDECQRCTLHFSWDSEGNFIDLSESCAGINCDDARCGSCFDLEYSDEGLPLRGTCDKCSTETNQCADLHAGADPDEEWAYCANTDTRDYPHHCVDVYSSEDHCGECDIPCDGDQVCSEGQCI
jgi:hypothetical protein